MALNIGNKVYRNLQEQVGYNSEQIDKIFSILDGIDYEDHVVVIENISTPLNEDEMAIVREAVSFLVYQDKLYFKDSSDSDNFYFSAVIDVDGDNIVSIRSSQISVNSSDGHMEKNDNVSEVYSSDETDLQITSLRDLISNLANGGPKGVYATLTDLETADPSHDFIYLVTENGKWYYYDTILNSWTAGGTYQSTGIAFGAVDIPELKKDIANNFESLNMFDKSRIVDGHYFNNDGTIGSYENSQYCSQYIPVTYGKTYVFVPYANIQYPIATYDKDGNFLARINNVNTETITFNSNVAFIRISIYNSNFDANFMFCEQGKVPTTYQDYKIWFNLEGVGKAVSDDFLDNVSQNPIQNATITNKLFDVQENVLVTDLEGISEAYSGYGSDYASGVAIVESASYVSYYFVATRNTEIYVEDTIAVGHYYSICVGRHYTPPIEEESGYVLLRSSSPTRYRNSDNNLPTEDNKLTIFAGDVVVFTFTQGAIYHIVGLGKLFTPKKQESEYKYKKTTNELDIETPHAKYVFKLVQNLSIRIDTWRLYAGYLKKPDGALFNMWSNTDAEGVVRINNEDDFIGGFHGDETMTALKIFVDGVDITNEADKSGSFETISIYVDSDVYHCNTSSTPDVVAFKRSKQLNFNKDKWTVSNCWTAQENLSIASAPMSLFQCDWKENDVEIASDYSVSPYYKNYTMQQATEAVYPPANKEMTEFYLETKYAHIDVRVLHTNGSPDNVKGEIAYTFVYEQNRIKYYYYNIFNSGTLISSGDRLTSQFEVEIK